MMNKIKNNLSSDTLVFVLVAFITLVATRKIDKHLTNKIDILIDKPEVTDVVIILLGAAIIPSPYSKAVVTGAGISLLSNVGKRTGLTK